VAQNLEIISTNFTFSTRRLLLLGTNRKAHGQNSGSLKKLKKSSRDTVPPYLHSAVFMTIMYCFPTQGLMLIMRSCKLENHFHVGRSTY